MKLINLHGKPVAAGKAPLICTPLVGRTGATIVAELGAVLQKKPDIIEWRVDFFEDIGNAATVVDIASSIRQACGDTPIIFTRRSMSEGGERIALDESDVLKLYVAVCASRCVDVIDYEMSNPTENIARLRDASRQSEVAMIMSYHNFKATPTATELVAKYRLAERLGADIAKVAVMPVNADDVLTLLSATGRASEECAIPLIGMSMGGLGAMSRVYGWAYGSALTFAVGKSASAPGQIAIEELRTLLAVTQAAAGKQ